MVRGSFRNRPAADRRRRPSAFARDPRSQSPIPIDRADERLDVDDIGLELNDQEAARRRMEGQDVDCSAFAVDGERRLRGRQPTGATELASRRLVHCRVAAVQHPIELTASPTGQPVDPDLQGCRDPDQHAHRDRLENVALHARHRGGRYAGGRRDVRLAPALPKTDGANHRSQSQRIHRRMLIRRCLRPAYCGLSCQVRTTRQL